MQVLFLRSILFVLVSQINNGTGTTTESTGSSGGDQTNLSARSSVSTDTSRETNMLMITTTEGMVHRVHAHTLNTRPSTAFGFIFVISSTGLEHRLISTTSTSNNTEHTTASRLLKK
jgi:hypothetical protein